MENEIALIRASLAGDSRSFESLVAKYQSMVCAITYSATGRVDVSEELAQETFLRAWKNLVQLKDLDRFRHWLCGISRNLIQDYYQKKQAEKVAYCDSETLTELSAASESTPSQALISQEEQMILSQAILRMPEEYREPLVLFYRQGQSIKEVANALELNEATVRTRLHRGRQMLKDEVAAMVERTLERTGPSKAFTGAVMVAIAGLAAGTAATAAAMGISSGASTSAAGGASVTAATAGFFTTAGVKVAAIAAAVIIGAGVMVYSLNSSNPPAKPIDVPATSPQPQPKVIADDSYSKDSPAIAAKSNLVQIASKETAQETPTQPQAVKAVAEPNKPYEFKPRGVLSGLITDTETGKPVTDAEISIWQQENRGGNVKFKKAKTDSNGFYYFDEIENSGNHQIGIISVDYVGIEHYKEPMLNLQKDKQIVEHFKLNKACKLQIRVVDEDGNPVEKADIYTVIASDDMGVGAGQTFYRTDKDGKVLIGGLPSKNNYFLTITHGLPGMEIRPGVHKSGKWDYAPAGLEIYLDKAGQTENTEVVLEKGQSLRGYVEYKDGKPASGVEIAAQPDWWQTSYSPQYVTVEPNGFFTLEQIVPGKYRIMSSMTGVVKTIQMLSEIDLPLEKEDVLKVKMPFDSPKPMASISGKVKFMAEKKPSFVGIEAFSRAGYVVRQTEIGRNERGELLEEFALDSLEPGVYDLRFSGPEIAEKTLTGISAPLDNLEVELVCIAKPKFHGMVIDAATKKPVTHFQICVRKLGTLQGQNWTQLDQSISFTKEDGTFEVEVVGPGIYQLQAAAEGYAPVWSEQLNTDNNTSALIQLPAGVGMIQGVVLNESGQPVKDAIIIPISMANGTMDCTKDLLVSDKNAVITDEKGRFQLTGLAAGLETLKVSHSDYTSEIVKDIQVAVVKDVQAALGQSAGNINVVLSKGVIVEGFVYDQEGNPEQGVVIYAQNRSSPLREGEDKAGRLGMATSDSKGFYRIKGLPEQVCFLMRQDQWNATGVVCRTILPTLENSCRADFGGKTCLGGRIILDGKPLVSQKIVLASEGNPDSGNFKAYASTDAEGRFVFRGLVPVRLAVYFQHQDNQVSNWVKLASVQGGDKDIDLGVIPQQISTIYVKLKQPADTWKITNLFLEKINSVSEKRVAHLPASPESPYVINSVIPGEYQLVVQRDDGVNFKQNITIPENQEQVDLSIILPVGNARIYGKFYGTNPCVQLWSADKKFQKWIRENPTGFYEVNNLPAGQYWMCTGLVAAELNSIPVYLANAQQLRMNLDKNTFAKVSSETLWVHVCSADGQDVDAKIYLAVDGRIIEPDLERYSLSAFVVPSGQYTLHVTCGDYKDFKQVIEIKQPSPGESPNAEKYKILVRLQRE